MEVVFSVVGVLGVLLVNEAWWRTHTVHSELGRKFVHVTVGSFVAFWPFFLSWTEIELLGAAFFVVVGVSKYFHVFRAIHSVQRPTLGELFFAMAVFGVAMVTHDKWIYMVALLQMSLADGMAAIFGASFGGTTRYTVLKHRKSLVGTLTFLVVSVGLLLVYNTYSGAAMGAGLIFGLALAASLVENIGVRGLDNLLVPLLVAVVLASR